MIRPMKTYHIPIFVYNDDVFAMSTDYEMPDGPPPLLILDVEPGTGFGKLTFGHVEGVEVSLSDLQEALALAQKINSGEVVV